MQNFRYISVLLGAALGVVVGAAPALAAGLQDEAQAAEMPAEPPTPSIQDVYVVMRDMGLAYQDVEIRTIVPNEEGVSALIGLNTGTLVDVTYTAGSIRYKVEVRPGLIVAQRMPLQRQTTMLENGTEVHLHWNAADTLLIDDS